MNIKLLKFIVIFMGMLIIFGIIIFEEPLLSFHYLGGLLVFTGVYLARKKV